MNTYSIRRFLNRNTLIIEIVVIALSIILILWLVPERADGNTKKTIVTTTTTLATTTTTLPPSTTIATTTTTIRPVATPTPVASSEYLCSLVDNYDWPTDVAYRVCMQESGGNSNAANWTDPHPELGCSGSFGLMQMNCGYGQLFDPKTNMDAAHTMWNKYGWKPWAGTCRKVGC